MTLASHVSLCEESTKTAYCRPVMTSWNGDGRSTATEAVSRRVMRSLKLRPKQPGMQQLRVEVDDDRDSDAEDEAFIQVCSFPYSPEQHVVRAKIHPIRRLQMKLRAIVERREAELRNRLRNKGLPKTEEENAEKKPKQMQLLAFSPKHLRSSGPDRKRPQNSSAEKPQRPPSSASSRSDYGSGTESQPSESSLQGPILSLTSPPAKSSAGDLKRRKSGDEDLFLTRWATADAAGREYKRYRETAVEVESMLNLMDPAFQDISMQA